MQQSDDTDAETGRTGRQSWSGGVEAPRIQRLAMLLGGGLTCTSVIVVQKMTDREREASNFVTGKKKKERQRPGAGQ